MSDGPFASREVRWFLGGAIDEHTALRDWFVFNECVPRGDSVPLPRWRGRRGDEPDLYLMLPGAEDMGIKWREGLLQIKGRVEHVGHERFDNGHAGNIERWLKWSYAGLPPAYRDLFAATDKDGRQTVAVQKHRMLRLLAIRSDGHIEETDPDLRIKRGINAELADIEVQGGQYTTLGFEAFPDDAVIASHFVTVVSRFLDSLGAPRLDAGTSHSYPDWLQKFSLRVPAK